MSYQIHKTKGSLMKVMSLCMVLGTIAFGVALSMESRIIQGEEVNEYGFFFAILVGALLYIVGGLMGLVEVFSNKPSKPRYRRNGGKY